MLLKHTISVSCKSPCSPYCGSWGWNFIHDKLKLDDAKPTLSQNTGRAYSEILLPFVFVCSNRRSSYMDPSGPEGSQCSLDNFGLSLFNEVRFRPAERCLCCRAHRRTTQAACDSRWGNNPIQGHDQGWSTSACFVCLSFPVLRLLHVHRTGNGASSRGDEALGVCFSFD